MISGWLAIPLFAVILRGSFARSNGESVHGGGKRTNAGSNGESVHGEGKRTKLWQLDQLRQDV